MIKGTKFVQKYIVSETIYLGFISLFNDKNLLHIDASFAKEKGFNSKVMHGNILNGFISHFIGECLPTKEIIIQSQEIKYSSPVYLNDILLLIVEILDYYESVQTFELKFLFKNELNNKMVAKGKIFIGKI